MTGKKVGYYFIKSPNLIKTCRGSPAGLCQSQPRDSDPHHLQVFPFPIPNFLILLIIFALHFFFAAIQIKYPTPLWHFPLQV